MMSIMSLTPEAGPERFQNIRLFHPPGMLRPNPADQLLQRQQYLDLLKEGRVRLATMSAQHALKNGI